MKQVSTGKGFAYLSIAELLVKLTSVIYIPVLIFILGDFGHGIYVISYEAFTLIYVLTNEGIQRGIAKLIAELNAKKNPRDALRAFKLSRTILIFGGLLASLLLYVMAPYIANAANSAEATLSIRALSPTILITAILSAYRGFFLGKNYISQNAFSKLIEQFVNITISLGASYIFIKINLELGVAGATLGTSIGALVAVIILSKQFYKGRLHKVKRETQDFDSYYHSNKELIKKLLKYSFPITLSAGLMSIGGFIDMFIVNKRLIIAGLTYTTSKVVFSHLSRFRTLLLVPNTISVSLAAVLLPSLSGAKAIGDENEIKEKIDFAVKMLLLITIPSFIGFTVLADPIYALLYPKSGGAELLKFGSITVIFLGFIQIQNVIFQSFSKFYWGVMTMVLGISLKLFSNFILVSIPSINIYGAVFSHFINYFVPFLLNHYLITKVLGYKMEIIKNLVVPLISSLIMGFVVYILSIGIRSLELRYIYTSILTMGNIIIGAFIFVYCLLIFGFIKKKEIYDLSPKLYRILPGFIKNKMKN